MPNYTQNYNLEKPTEDEFYDVGVQNGNMDKLDETIASIDTAKAAAKNTIADGDSVSIVDSADSSKTKRVLWSTIKSAMGQIFVPLTRKVNNKDLSADISLTGDDIATSATDGTTVSSQLSNRLRLPIAIPANADLNDYVSPGMYFCSANAQNVANIPPDSITGAFSLLVEYSGAYGNGCKQTFTEHNPGITYIRRMSDISAGHWSAWEPLSTATPPQEFDLLLAEGWLPIDARYAAVYWKTQESIVNISLSLKSDHTVTNGEIIATLPAEFRPKKSLKIPITAVNQNGLLVHGYVDINRSDGTIQIYKITDQIKELCFPTTNFLANG